MKVYAYKNTDEILMQSSSGGAFSRLIEAATQNINGKFSIYGATWNKELLVEHRRVTTVVEASIFRGSKYIRSNLLKSFGEIECDLNKGLLVIFSGTPCQVNGLNLYLERKKIPTNNLLTIDLICHGSPNPIVWKDCKKWLEKKYKSRIKKVSFRDKSIGWKRYPTRLELEDGRVIKWTYLSQIYIRLFLSLYILEKKCFSCQFSSMNRVSDLTIGDFWGIEEAFPKFNSNKGVSIILANTKKGDSLCAQILKELQTDESMEEFKGESQIFLKYQHNLNQATEKPEDYEEFWKYYNENGFSKMINHYGFVSVKRNIRFRVKKICLKFKKFDDILP